MDLCLRDVFVELKLNQTRPLKHLLPVSCAIYFLMQWLLCCVTYKQASDPNLHFVTFGKANWVWIETEFAFFLKRYLFLLYKAAVLMANQQCLCRNCSQAEFPTLEYCISQDLAIFYPIFYRNFFHLSWEFLQNFKYFLTNIFFSTNLRLSLFLVFARNDYLSDFSPLWLHF